MKTMRSSQRIVILLVCLWAGMFAAWGVSSALAQSPLDAFDPNANAVVRTLAIQPDGKILLGGGFTTIGGTTRNCIARFKANGLLDTSFDPGSGANAGVIALAMAPDGKILLGGDFSTINGTARSCVARLNADGSLDTSFDPGTGANSLVIAVATQTDGKILLGGFFTTINGTSRNRIARLNADGSLDTSFDPGTGASAVVNTLATLPDGKILLGGQFTTINGTARNRIARLNADGSLDTSFDPGTGAPGAVNALATLPDGKILLGGGFTTINGTARNRIARLNADGSLDTSFDPGTGADNTVNAVAIQTDGKVLLGGGFTTVNGTARNRVARLNADGSLDTTFDAGTGANAVVWALPVQSDGKVVLGGLFTTINGTTRNYAARLNADGSLEIHFNPDANGEVHSLATQPDGKILLGGQFTSISGTARNCIARLNADGSLDTSFDPGTGADGPVVLGLALQRDGKVVLGGWFTTINGTARNRVARLNSDGSLDTSFDPGTGADNTVHAVATQTDGKILLGGYFTTINGTARNRVARLNADGSLDTSFDPGTGANNLVNAVAIRSGKILLGGHFTTINGTARNRVAQLNGDGSLDTSFDPGTGPDYGVYTLATQPGGKTLLGGYFTTINGTTRNRVARLNSDGSLDTSFDPGTGPDHGIFTLALQANGKILLGGDFTTINGTARNRVARLNADGSLDTSFDPGTGTNDSVYGLALQPDGKVLLSGPFTTINSTARNRIARLSNPDEALEALSVAPGGVSATWTLGGSYPQPCQVLFEESPDGSTWSALGWGVVLPGVGYQRTGLSLPVKTYHYLRATAWATGGENNGSISLHRSLLRFWVPGKPSAPTNPGATSVSTGAITWTWQDNSDDETGFKVWADAGAGDPATLRTTTAADATSWPMPSLTANTQYAFQVAATNLCGDSAKTNNYTAWTLAAVPVAPTVSNPTPSSLDVAIGAGDGNPTGTPYAIHISPAIGGNAWVQANGSLGAGVVWQTAAAWGTKTVTGLTESTNYTFAAKARNGASVETALGAGASGQTPYAPRTLTYNAGPHGSISGTSPQTVAYGTDGAPVTAVSDPGYHFVIWSDGKTDNPRTDTNVTADINVTAFFIINGSYLLTYLAGHGGTIVGANPQTVVGGLDGEPVSAVAEIGHYFVNWSDARTDNPRTDTNITGNLVVTANFAHYTRTVTFQTDGTPEGSITGTNPQTVDYGSDCTSVTANAPTGYHFVKWTRDGGDYSTENPLTVTNVTQDMTLVAVFEIIPYTVTFQTDGTPGAILIGDLSQTVNYGTDCTSVTAQAPEGYLFLKWTREGATYSTDRSLIVTHVTEAMTLTSVFVQPPATKVEGEWILYE